MKTIIVALAFLFALCSALQGQQIKPFEENDRVVFLGNSITDGGHYHSFVWLYYMTRFPNMPVTVMNAGIGGDRASDMYKRLDGDVFSKRPTVLIATFGMNDSGYFEYNQPEPEKFAERMYQESYETYKKIEQRFKTLSDTRIVLMGSSPYDETAVIEGNTAFRNKNKTMLRMVDLQRQSANQNGWEFIDLNQPMTEINQREQKKDPTFALCGKDRIHPDNDGHMAMAYLLLKAQGMAGKEIAVMDIDAATKTVKSGKNCEISQLKTTGNSFSFNYLAHALPYPMDSIPRGWGSKKSQVDALDIIPFTTEMNQEILKISGLKGKYRLSIDGIIIGEWNTSDFAKGINLALESKTPQYQQALTIMYLNEERWEIERRFREYAWMQFNLFQKLGLLFADDRKAIEALDKAAPVDGWVAAKRDIYTKAMHQQVRDAWQGEMDLLVSKIYEINQPLRRKIILTKVN